MRHAPIVTWMALLAGACGEPSCPPTEPEPWLECIETDPASEGCSIVLPVDTGALTVTAPSFTCELPDYLGPSACYPEYGVEPELHQSAYEGVLWYPVPGPLQGSSFRLRYARSADGTGVARFCRVGRTDVGSGGDCWPADWECAQAGSVTLNEDESGELALEFTATFADGGTVTGAF